jgi:hypothetical protein
MVKGTVKGTARACSGNMIRRHVPT